MTFFEHILASGSRLRTRLFTAIISTQFRHIGRGTRIQPPFRCMNFGQISLEDEVMIHRDCWIHVVGDSAGSNSSKLIIKSHAGIGMGATISAAQQVVIEEYVLLARNVYISDNSHAFEDVTDPIMCQGMEKPKPVLIGRHSWLGQNVCILPGVSIGEHCIVGANSVVKSSIPDFSVAVGSPARVVKRYHAKLKRWEKVNGLLGQTGL